ncbi:MAG: inner membrane-spanning protein YciB [Oceanococcaceae bacterium]
MKQLLDSLPALAFLAGVLLRDIYTATVWLMLSLVALVLYYRLAEKRWHRTHLITAAVAIVLGGLTLAIRDPLFIKYKPTAIYGGFAVALGLSHFWGSKVLLARLPQQMVDLPEALWRKVNASWALFFALCAGANVLLALSLSDEHWALAKTFGFPVAWFLFVLAHLPFVAPYMRQEKEDAHVVRDHRA